MRRLAPTDYRTMPWRNGGGLTTEIAIEPPDASVGTSQFLYRVSIADVASDGPFSLFEGYDRHILLLAGSGMILDCGAHGRVELRAPFEPRSFSGDWDVKGTLISGPVRDFNVIVNRSRAASSLVVYELLATRTLALAAGSTWIVHVLEGSVDGADKGHTLVGDGPVELVSRGARVAVAQIIA